MMSPDYSKRGYLLPKGCKDLIDVIKLQQAQQPQAHCQPSNPVPAIAGDLLVREQISVGELAALLGQKPFKFIADLMEIGVFASVKQTLDFKTISKVARKYGYTAKRPA